MIIMVMIMIVILMMIMINMVMMKIIRYCHSHCSAVQLVGGRFPATGFKINPFSLHCIALH